ncbi:G patch domain-containing protein [Dirofilaria immitis]
MTLTKRTLRVKIDIEQAVVVFIDNDVAYYRCPFCDRLYQEHGEGSRYAFMIVNNTIHCSASVRYHSGKCKP